LDLRIGKNLYSSEAGDSSINLQKQYSEYEQKDLIGTSTFDKKTSVFKKNSIDSVEFQSLMDKSKYEESFNNMNIQIPDKGHP
jgi:hypothetical protein